MGTTKLKRWTIHEESISGYVSGSDRYREGAYIKTSRVVAAAYDGKVLLVRTRNSVYECAEADYVGDPEQLLIFIRIFAEDQGGSTTVL